MNPATSIELQPHRQHDRQPPYAAEAETSVLGGMLIDNDAVSKAIEIVDDSMFYREANRRLYRAMTRIFQRGDVVDPVTVSEELKKTDELEAVGGLSYLAELLDAVPTAANLQYHARLIRERALLRRLIEASSQIIRDAYDPGEKDVDQLLDEAEHRIFQVAQMQEREGFVWIKKLLYGAFERIEQLQDAKGGITGVSTGFRDLDYKTGGFQRGDLVIVAARPSMGKTAFVITSALHAAISHQVPVAVFSLEMSKEQLVQRMLCSEGLVDLGRLLRGRLEDDDYVRLAQAAGHLNAAPMYIDDSGALSLLEMRAKARRLKADVPELGLLVVDYIQLMQGRNAENRQQEVSEISRGLKALAKELGLPIIALSQLSRAPEQRSDHRPQLSDLRESGSIEQDADLVMFLYRPEYYLGDLEAQEQNVVGRAELIISKQRNGPTGTVELFFRKEFTRFEAFAREEPLGAPHPSRAVASGSRRARACPPLSPNPSMARLRTAFFCTECGNESARWAGQCPACGAWNALAEEPLARQGARRPVGAGAGPATLSRPIRLADVGEQERVRWSTGMAELDFVLGGGLVPGSLVLLGGEPGIGKSTLLLQLGAALELRGHPTLYVSGEESAAQVGMRAQRLSAGASGVTFLAETSLERIVAQAVEVRPAVLFIDSIQTVHVGELDGAPGSVGQVREAAARLQRFAKESGVAIFLVGHVTKGGAVAGPKTLEHIVDSVLYFEAATGVDHRILRATKNRFGGVDEIGVFRMTPAGLEVVENPSELFLRDRSAPGPGSAVAAVMEGTRPLLVEVQALCATASYGAPQRVSTGFDRQRLALLLAVLETRGGLDFRRLDVFINVVGGLRLAEPAGDLAVVAALASSALERAPPPAAVFIGELGLGGELRAPGQLDRRLAEAARMGFTSAYLPAGRASSSALPRPDASGSSPNGAAIRGVGLATVGELLREAFG